MWAAGESLLWSLELFPFFSDLGVSRAASLTFFSPLSLPAAPLQLFFLLFLKSVITDAPPALLMGSVWPVAGLSWSRLGQLLLSAHRGRPCSPSSAKAWPREPNTVLPRNDRPWTRDLPPAQPTAVGAAPAGHCRTARAGRELRGSRGFGPPGMSLLVLGRQRSGGLSPRRGHPWCCWERVRGLPTKAVQQHSKYPVHGGTKGGVRSTWGRCVSEKIPRGVLSSGDFASCTLWAL